MGCALEAYGRKLFLISLVWWLWGCESTFLQVLKVQAKAAGKTWSVGPCFVHGQEKLGERVLLENHWSVVFGLKCPLGRGSIKQQMGEASFQSHCRGEAEPRSWGPPGDCGPSSSAAPSWECVCVCVLCKSGLVFICDFASCSKKRMHVRVFFILFKSKLSVDYRLLNDLEVPS